MTETTTCSVMVKEATGTPLALIPRRWETRRSAWTKGASWISSSRPRLAGSRSSHRAPVPHMYPGSGKDQPGPIAVSALPGSPNTMFRAPSVSGCRPAGAGASGQPVTTISTARLPLATTDATGSGGAGRGAARVAAGGGGGAARGGGGSGAAGMAAGSGNRAVKLGSTLGVAAAGGGPARSAGRRPLDRSSGSAGRGPNSGATGSPVSGRGWAAGAGRRADFGLPNMNHMNRVGNDGLPGLCNGRPHRNGWMTRGSRGKVADRPEVCMA